MTQPAKPSFLQTIKIMLSWKMMVMFFFGFSSGFPYYIIKDVLKIWMTESNVDLATIGLFSALGLPYTLKFVWSPLMDGYVPRFLGRRRGWILIAQIGLMISIALIGQFDPSKTLFWIVFMALCINFFGASQDISLDAFRREYLSSNELGFGTGVWMNAWRLGMYVSVGLSLLTGLRFSWASIHIILALMMGIGILTTLFVSEPEIEEAPPVSIKEAVTEPFLEFFKRHGALLILLFILLYKIGDNMAGAMTIPFILKMGFSKAEYFVIVKGIGMFGLFGGVILGGSIMIRLGIAKSLWVFGILQAVSTALFAILVMMDHHSVIWMNYRQIVLGGIVGFEFFSTGLGQAAYATYMAIQTNKRFTATQYALLTSLMAVPGVFAASVTGFMAKYLGWEVFYILCALFAIPGLLLLLKIAPWNTSNETLEAGR
ncbi:MAG: MFS transporter [Proteobacteria bacterium]|nr:MFS transporter [Pseudomonadota bacterium]MBU1584281.1 MFS transporter [Pseudomonadota bacterium]MBU2451825.1 MFS transporter [Pseudomonadota bacterium]MBU2631173.1 MFS transporter [Pseudomonadota bacterium]